LRFPDYAYKEASLNPTNPADHATDWEADIINTFRNDPALKEFSTVRDTVTGPVLVVARPVNVDDKSSVRRWWCRASTRIRYCFRKGRSSSSIA